MALNQTIQKYGAPFCDCVYPTAANTVSWPSFCDCGEEYVVNEWSWQQPMVKFQNSIRILDNNVVMFHPQYSSGTAYIKGDTSLRKNNHYYWEVKMLTDPYGTDIMVGAGSSKMSDHNSQLKFISLLGMDEESYGLSYKGNLQHKNLVTDNLEGFCKGSIIGVRVDLWHGTLEFYLNRKSLGKVFHGLRCHQDLYPMVSSTSAQSALKLIYSASWRGSLLVDAAKSLASSIRNVTLPPGLTYTQKRYFWLSIDDEGVPKETVKGRLCEQTETTWFVNRRMGHVSSAQMVMYLESTMGAGNILVHEEPLRPQVME